MGAALGEWMMGKRLGSQALAWGALVGLVPGILSIFSPLLDSARQMSVAHGGGHSLVFMALGIWGLTNGLAKLWKREKITKLEIARFVGVVWGCHVFLDCLTFEGASLLWPVTTKIAALNIVHPLDPLLALPLIVTVIWMAFTPEQSVKKSRSTKKQPTPKRLKLVAWGLGLSVGYLGLAAGAKALVSSKFDSDLSRRGVKYQRRMEAPMHYNIFLWRGLVDQGTEIWVGYRSVFEWTDTPVHWSIYPKAPDSLAAVANMRETKTLTGLSNGWWIARNHARGAWLGDMRYPELRVWDEKKNLVDERLPTSWVIDAGARKERLRRIYTGNKNDPTYAKRMFSRIWVDRKSWEGYPRLVGVPGSLPEFLGFEP